MLTYRSYRTELDPTSHQRVLLARLCGAARFAYNWGLARRIEAYQSDRTVLTSIALHRELNALKRTDFPWLYEVSKCAPHEALRDLDQAFSLFFRGLKSGRRVGFPRFKRRKLGRATFRLNGVIRVFARQIQLPRLGKLRLKEGVIYRLPGRTSSQPPSLRRAVAGSSRCAFAKTSSCRRTSGQPSALISGL